MKKSKNDISKWLKKYEDKRVDNFIDVNTSIASKIYNRMKGKGWSKRKLAKEMNITENKIEQWMTGLHNLTLRNITDLELVLEIELIIK